MVTIVTRVEDGRLGFETRQEQEISFLSKTSRPTMGPTQSPIRWVAGLFPGVKRSGPEECHSPPHRVKVKNEWRYTLSPPIRLHGEDRTSFFF